MRFPAAVALTVILLWVPVDGVAQTEAQRRLLELYESRERQLLASMDPEADEQRENAARMRCAAAALADRRSCLTQVYELVTQQLDRRSSVGDELYEIRLNKLELEGEILQETFQLRMEELESLRRSVGGGLVPDDREPAVRPGRAFGQMSDLLIFGGSGHDEFLGCLNCSGYSADSICNGYGTYGSEYSSSGMFNEYAGFGNEYSSSSPWNEYSSSNSVPVVVDREGNFFGYFTINEYRSDGVDFSGELNAIYEAADGDLEVVRTGLCEILN